MTEIRDNRTRQPGPKASCKPISVASQAATPSAKRSLFGERGVTSALFYPGFPLPGRARWISYPPQWTGFAARRVASLAGSLAAPRQAFKAVATRPTAGIADKRRRGGQGQGSCATAHTASAAGPSRAGRFRCTGCHALPIGSRAPSGTARTDRARWQRRIGSEKRSQKVTTAHNRESKTAVNAVPSHRVLQGPPKQSIFIFFTAGSQHTVTCCELLSRPILLWRCALFSATRRRVSWHPRDLGAGRSTVVGADGGGGQHAARATTLCGVGSAIDPPRTV